MVVRKERMRRIIRMFRMAGVGCEIVSTGYLTSSLLLCGEESLQCPGELVRVLLLQVESQELHVLLEEPLATQTDGVSLWRRGGGMKASGWQFLQFLIISKHEGADKLWVVMNKVARAKSRF